MVQNKTSKYFKYAIGEIILVVIGILIALQINNWNDNRMKSNRKKELVVGLISEFETNYNQLETVIKEDSLNVVISIDLQKLIKKSKSSVQDSMVRKLLSGISTYTFNPTNGVLKSGISSGTIHFINNETLKRQLFAWEDVVKDAQEEEILSKSDFFQRMIPILEKYVQIGDYLDIYSNQILESKFSSNYFALLQDPQFENILVVRSALVLDALSELRPLRETNKKIIKLLQKELKND
jgi:hypothetical protein